MDSVERYLEVFEDLRRRKRWSTGLSMLRFAALTLAAADVAYPDADLEATAKVLADEAGGFSPLGSAMRHAVAAILLRRGLDPVAIAGCSIGAVVGALAAAGLLDEPHRTGAPDVDGDDRGREEHRVAQGQDRQQVPGCPGDLDGSGAPGQPDALFLQQDDGSFVDVAPELGLDRDSVGRGLLMVDADGREATGDHMMGLLAPTSGEVLIGGQRVNELPPARRPARGTSR